MGTPRPDCPQCGGSGAYYDERRAVCCNRPQGDECCGSPEPAVSQCECSEMTNSNWKPVPHAMACGLRPGIGGQCKCNGTRWHGYGERVGDFAAMWAFAQGMAWLSEGG